MLYRLISLVFLFIVINFTMTSSADDANFIYPKNKPSVFKKIKTQSLVLKKPILPANKPSNKKPEVTRENLKVIEKKTLESKKITEVKSKKIIRTSNLFVYPKKKPAVYKKTTDTKKVSTILKQKDFDKAKEVFNLINDGKWISAIKLSDKVSDNDFKKLVKWLYLKQPGNRATFNDYKNFIQYNQEYPRISRLRYLAEHKIILNNSTPKSIANWFELNPPLSGTGKIKLAEAFFLLKKESEAISLLKSGWETADLSKNDLRYYRNKFRKFLNEDDHIKRADYLAWNNKYWDLKRMLRYLPKDERALYNARQILMSNSYGVDKSISDVPNHLKNNIGLQYDRLKWRNRRGRLEQSIEILFKNSNKSEQDLVRGDLWWKQRESIVRTLVYKKRYKTAYKVSSEHSLSTGPEYAEAEWLSGWIALTFLQSGEYAVNHFQNFYSNVGYPISLGRGAYWLGQAYKSFGDTKNAEIYFNEGSKYLTTFYGQLSFNEINPGSKFTLKDDSSYSEEYEKKFQKNKLINHVILLKELDRTKFSKDIIKHLATLNIGEGSEILAAKLASQIERYDYAIQISKKASYEKRFFNEYNYPIINTPRIINKKQMPPPELVLAVIRQESEFDRKANSYVGAKGMMQLMKYTAKLTAKQAKLPYSISGLTKNPEYNIKLGSYYLNNLLNNYGQVYPFAIAAYNAGPNRVKTWNRINGDPRTKSINYVNWIELIRFKETRNYVQRVLENVNVYRYMLNKSPVEVNNFFIK